MTTCTFCQEPIEQGQTVLQRASGWVKCRGATGGANALQLKQVYPEFAHAGCLDKQRLGSSDQIGMEGALW